MLGKEKKKKINFTRRTMAIAIWFRNFKNKGIRHTTYDIRHTQSKASGFTLVEMIVSLGFFTVVMLVVISVLASVAGANEKGRTMRIVIDNLNFAVENMSRTLRVGSRYHCGESGELTTTQDCPSGDKFIAFRNIQSGDITTAFRRNVDDNGVGFIERSNTCSTSCSEWLRITAPEINVNFLSFYTKGSGEVDGSQAQILMIANGTAGKGNIQTDFDIQTTVTQRLADS